MFDLAIIGGGPAGYTAAERAAVGGFSVVLFEKRPQLGGVCLNEGCIPTKTLLYSSKLYHQALDGAKYGITANDVSCQYDKVVARKNKIVRKLGLGIKGRMSENHITVIEGEANVEKNETGVVTVSCNGESYEAKYLLACTGSETMIPPIKGLDSAEYWTSCEALESKEVPESLVIIGGGVIGMEFAGLFSMLGAKVAIVEMVPEILPGIDAEISALLREEYAKRGVEFHLGAKVTEINTGKVSFEDANGVSTIETSQVLLAVGRVPNLKGLESLNLEPNRRGVKVDETMKTSVDNVYAAGDITGFSMLAHTAEREADVAVNNMLGKADIMSYHAIPGVIYTYPEVAGVGLTEDAAKAQNLNVTVKKLPMTYAGRFVVENERGSGLCKLVIDEHDVVVGAHVIGNPASEIISAAVVAIESRMKVDVFKKVVFPHPTVSEIFKETIFS